MSRFSTPNAMKFRSLLALAMLATAASLGSAQENRLPARCEVVPLAGRRVSFRIDGLQRTRWHFGSEYPRPFFFPLSGPSGVPLTRMGHPGAANHDHHRSVWFAHAKLRGVDFWSDNTEARVKQKHWLAYADGEDECVMASLLGWYDADGRELMQQQLVAALIPMPGGEHGLEFQSTFRPAGSAESVMLEKTNFGFLAVRVAKSLSAHFGGGLISNSEGDAGEADVFGKQARWVDYSGPVAVGAGPERKLVEEGITYFDHPANPRYPTYWHVRDDGWMGASFGMHEPYEFAADDPLVLRYLLHAHAGRYHAAKAARVAEEFAKRPGFEVKKSERSHRQWEVERQR